MTLLVVSILLSLPFLSTAQEWKSTEVAAEDTIVQTQVYVDDKGNPISDTTGTHKIVYKYLKYYLLGWERYSLENKPTEDVRGVHRKEKFWKYYKFYDKNNQQLSQVKDSYKYDQGNATYCIYKYNEHGDIIEVAYYKDEAVLDKKENVVVRNRVKAVGAYKGMTHKFIYHHSNHSKIIKEHLYGLDNKLQEVKTFKRKPPKKKKMPGIGERSRY